jgi:hypothetical protein
MKKLDLLILILLLLSPIIVKYVALGSVIGAPTHTSFDGWLGYYGTLVGALVTMFVLYRTRGWNRDDNDETRRMQTKMLEFQAKNLWFENFRKQLDENYRILNFQDTIIAVNDISTGNCQKAMQSLLELNKNIEMQGYTFDLYLPTDKLSSEEMEYVISYNEVLKSYGTYVNDLIVICGLRLRLEAGLSILEYINESVSQLVTLNELNKDVEPSSFILKLSEMCETNCTIKDIGEYCTQRVVNTGFIHSTKAHLAKVTKTLLKYEEKKIEQILK